ncbi:hypothetical protein CLORY_25350 [Clostridium oryzae]|uniref:Uncharacterized protein n=1 Tax=Clostridium oryzae TaxID=1450648 RepID=A0A1V4IM42_9CLOT|nr:hypothetical protein CLORY_25350 [Clostridium oryzae]
MIQKKMLCDENKCDNNKKSISVLIYISVGVFIWNMYLLALEEFLEE